MDERQHLPLRLLREDRRGGRQPPREKAEPPCIPSPTPRPPTRQLRSRRGRRGRTVHRRRHHAGRPDARDRRTPRRAGRHQRPAVPGHRPAAGRGCGSVRWCGWPRRPPTQGARTFPVISEALELSASAQLRNMATIGGNIMQRTRCTYFRDVTAACNKREPGSGCAALDGFNRTHAILGTSDALRGHPSLRRRGGLRRAGGARAPARARTGSAWSPSPTSCCSRAATPDREQALRPGELITAVEIPATPDRDGPAT